MSKLRMRGLFKAKSRLHRSTTDLAEWTKNDEKLMKAVEKEDAKKVASLLSKKSLIPTKLGYQGSSVFHIACAVGNVQIVDLFLKEISNVNDLTIQGNTALQLASAKGHPAVIEKLLQASADVDLGDNHEMTALHHACAGLHLECVKMLLAGNASPHLKEKGGKTPLFYAAHRGDANICKCLIDKGAYVNCKDSVSVTPLMIAAKEGHIKICELLIKRGADPTITDREGNAAVIYAYASGHQDIQELLAKAPQRFLPDSNSMTASESGSQPSDAGSKKQEEAVVDPVEPIEILPTNAAVTSDDETVSQADVQSVHSMDDSLMVRAHHSPKPSPKSKTEKAFLELKSEHDQLNEDFSSLSIENLRLRDKVESLQIKLNDKHQQEGACMPQSLQDEIRNLKTMLDEEKEKNRRIEEERKQIEASGEQISGSSKQTENSSGTSSGDGGIVSEEDESLSGKIKSDSSMDERQSLAKLQREILTIRKENELLKASTKLPNGLPHGRENEGLGVKSDGDLLKSLQFENCDLKEHLLQLQSECEKERLSGVDYEELVRENQEMTKEIGNLKKQVEEFESGKNSNQTDSQRIDALVAGSQNFEENVKFDEEGFVLGRDMTKEEFLQAQNQQLKTHCGLVTKELEKLRSQFYAILEAGDQLQADYDQLAGEKDSLHDELEVALKAKAEIVQENEFLLNDNNALHEDLKKLVHELEKMQDRNQVAQTEIEELKRSVTVASKVGEVSRLLEERDTLLQKCKELEQTSERLQSDHSLLLEEVESLNEMVTQLTSERNAMSAEVEEMASICQHHEGLQQDYTQLEHDFGELVREKEALERNLLETSQVSRLPADTTQSLGDSLNDHSFTESEGPEQFSSLNEQKLREERAGENLISEVDGIDSTDKAEENDGPVDRMQAEKKYQDEIASLKHQIGRMSKDIEAWEKRHEETVHTYRTHLLSAVQGHMDPDVKDALYHIIELRSMEQFC